MLYKYVLESIALNMTTYEFSFWAYKYDQLYN